MSLRHYGIYIAYAPTVDLRGEGLGRHLAMFLKGAESLKDIRFSIVCPSWSKASLEALFESEQVSAEVFDIVSPLGKPYALRLYEALQASRNKPKDVGWFSRAEKYVRNVAEGVWLQMTERAVAVHGVSSFIRFMLEVSALFFVLTPLTLLAIPFLLITALVMALGSKVKGAIAYFKNIFISRSRRVSSLFTSPHHESWVLRLFDAMNKQEAVRMQAVIKLMVDVRAWYCPTAFWPEFNDIKAPRLMCVPDVVLSEFPAGFSNLGGNRFLTVFEVVGRAIRSGENFVTYSDSVKWNTLVDNYGISATNIAVIPHAPNFLNQHIAINGFPDMEASSQYYCQALLMGVLHRFKNSGYTGTFQNGSVKFLFYASQFRPNKNVMMLLHAYTYLLRKRFLGHKLILTGRPGAMPEIDRYIVDHRLENDVLFVPGLSVAELAACYKLADLAVNPSLSEGGCPFTFTEALSVGTPVLMSRISVAEEVLTDPGLQALTFFDPYDWRDCANRIEWAVKHRAELLSIQQETYARLIQRTWSDVVSEHVQALERIAEHAQQGKH